MADMSLHDELLKQQQETMTSFIISLEEEISQNSQQAQCLIEKQGSNNLPKSILGQVEALLEKKHQNVSKLQTLEEINGEATETVEEQYCRLEEVRMKLITPLTLRLRPLSQKIMVGQGPKLQQGPI